MTDGQKLYNAYRANYMLPLPQWADLPSDMQMIWEAVAAAFLAEV